MSRAEAERILGRALWHVGSDANCTYEAYEYLAEQPPRPVKGATLAVLDYFSLGSFEYILHDEADFAPHKQVVIGYDSRGVVVLKVGPWLVDAAPACRRMRSLLPADAGLPAAAHVVDESGAQPLPARLKVDSEFSAVRLDDQPFSKREAPLVPGHHSLTYRARGYDGSAIDLEALPAHTYALKFYKESKGIYFIWLEDAATHEALQCYRSP